MRDSLPLQIGPKEIERQCISSKTAFGLGFWLRSIAIKMMLQPTLDNCHSYQLHATPLDICCFPAKVSSCCDFIFFVQLKIQNRNYKSMSLWHLQQEKTHSH